MSIVGVLTWCACDNLLKKATDFDEVNLQEKLISQFPSLNLIISNDFVETFLGLLISPPPPKRVHVVELFFYVCGGGVFSVTWCGNVICEHCFPMHL